MGGSVDLTHQVRLQKQRDPPVWCSQRFLGRLSAEQSVSRSLGPVMPFDASFPISFLLLVKEFPPQRKWLLQRSTGQLWEVPPPLIVRPVHCGWGFAGKVLAVSAAFKFL